MRVVFFCHVLRSEQAAAAMAMRSKWKSELMRKRGKGRGDIFDVLYISNFHCAPHLELSICNTYWIFNLQQILNFQFARNIQFFNVQQIFNFQCATNLELPVCNTYWMLNFQYAINIKYSIWKVSQKLFWQHQLVPKLKGQKHIPPYTVVTWLVSLL